MVVMLGVSTLAAALVPSPEEDGEGTATKTRTRGETTRKPPPALTGRLVEASVSAGRREPRRIELRRGDRVSLTVQVSRAREVEIPSLGLLTFAQPGTPATFQIYASRRGRFRVRLLEPTRTVAVLVIDGAPQGS